MNLNLRDLIEATGAKLLTSPEPDLLINGVGTDTRADLIGQIFVALVGESFDAHDFLDKALAQGAAALCVSQEPADLAGISVPVLIVADTSQAYRDIARFYRQSFAAKVIGITGSCGKTSVKSIVAQLAEVFYPKQVSATKANLNNTIGVPLTLLSVPEQASLAVVEMGISECAEMSKLVACAAPDLAILTNVGNSHLGNFADRNELLAEKARIITESPSEAKIILSHDLLSSLTKELGGRDLLTVGYEAEADFELLAASQKGRVNHVKFSAPNGQEYSFEHSLGGKEHGLNVLFALASFHALGLDWQNALPAISSCELPGMRLAWKETAEAEFLLDCYNANPQSTRAFIDYLAEALSEEERQGTAVVLGDMLELGEHSYELHHQTLAYAKKRLCGASLLTVGAHYANASAGDPEIFCLSSSLDTIELLAVFPQKQRRIIALKGSRGISLEKIYQSFLGEE